MNEYTVISFKSLSILDKQELRDFIKRNRKYAHDYKRRRYHVSGLNHEQLLQLARELFVNIKRY